MQEGALYVESRIALGKSPLSASAKGDIAAMKRLQGITVWLVDDDDAVRDSLRILLECEGLSVHGFRSGEALLKALPLEGDCLLLDLYMPDMDGFAVMAALNDRSIDIPILTMTGHGDKKIEAQVLCAGAQRMLNKPIQDRALLAALRDTCSSAKRH